MSSCSVSGTSDTYRWLGREESNLRMAESKSGQFSFLINRHSEKTAKFSPNSINRLGRVSECRRECAEPALPHYDSRGLLGTLTAQSSNRSTAPVVPRRRQQPDCRPALGSDRRMS